MYEQSKSQRPSNPNFPWCTEYVSFPRALWEQNEISLQTKYEEKMKEIKEKKIASILGKSTVVTPVAFDATREKKNKVLH